MATVLPSPRCWATIDLTALQHNLRHAAALCPDAKLVPVIKSNAYGHGMQAAARALAAAELPIAAFAVATLQEAIDLKKLELDAPVLLLSGGINTDELHYCLANQIQLVVHSPFQLELIESLMSRAAGELERLNKTFWVKFNSGMNRLGQAETEAVAIAERLSKLPNSKLVFMSHFACADQPDEPIPAAFTENQMARFDAARAKLASKGVDFENSLAASAGVLKWPASHHHYIRPGIMLYGGSPLAIETGAELGLKPVMTLRSRLMAINSVAAGESIGYGATYTCAKDKRVGVVSIGYGDGYPRAAINGTPVLVKSAGKTIETQLIGRVSMDMVTIDLDPLPEAAINDEVVLWGEGLSADIIARHSDTIAYELFCKVTARTVYHYEPSLATAGSIDG